MTRRPYPPSRARCNPPSEHDYNGPLPRALEGLRPFLVEHDDVIRSILATQSAIKNTIATLEAEHEALSDRLCEYAEAS